jgi:hypothetical protein
VIRQTNNQALAPRPAYEWKHVHMIFEKHLLRTKKLFAHVGHLVKKLTIGDKTKPLGSQKVGLKNKQLGVTSFEYFIVSSKIRKCQFRHVLLHLEK